MQLILIIVVLLSVGASVAEQGNFTVTERVYCPDLKPQPGLDLEGILEKWYVVQVVKHLIDPTKPVPSARVSIETCPTVKLRFKGQGELKLVWTERAGDLEYSFRVPDLVRSPGLWISTGFQNGTLARKDYKQFTGKVQVMKAVASHMVLNFCSRTPDNQLYSIILSRGHALLPEDEIGVHNLLERRGVTIVSVQESCRHGSSDASKGISGTWLTMITILAATYATIFHAI